MFNFQRHDHRIDVGASHFDHLLHENLYPRCLLRKAALDERIIGQHDLHHNLIAATTTVQLLATVHRQALHHIPDNAVTRQQLVVAEQFDVCQCHNTVARGNIIT